jgi:aspartate/glutamate racemase
MPQRIALIHATPVAMPPVTAAFRQGWPEVDTMNLLDDALSTDLARRDTLDAPLMRRIATLADYAMEIGVDGILFTCSAFGAAIEAVARTASIPVLKPNEAMFEDALGAGTTVGLLATFQPSIPSMEQEFVAMAKALGKRAKLEAAWVPDAMEALTAGNTDQHDRLIAATASRLTHCDVVLLAQFSMARALPTVRQAIGQKVLTSPDSAVAKLKALLSGGAET